MTSLQNFHVDGIEPNHQRLAKLRILRYARLFLPYMDGVNWVNYGGPTDPIVRMDSGVNKPGVEMFFYLDETTATIDSIEINIWTTIEDDAYTRVFDLRPSTWQTVADGLDSMLEHMP